MLDQLTEAAGRSLLEALVREFDEPGAPGASVIAIRDGQVRFARGFGLADLEEKRPCSETTNFRLASLTKQFTAMAVLILASRKVLALDEPILEVFPEFGDYAKEVTIRHLLSHTSGLADYEELIPRGTQLPLHDRDVLRLLMGQKQAYFAAGTNYRYSNSGYALLALAVEARSGLTFAHFLRQEIFEPLAMDNTLAYEAGLRPVPNRAYGYNGIAGAFRRTDQSLTSSVLGDGGIYSSVADLYHWDQALYSGQLVSSESLEEAFTPSAATDLPNTGYGFGWYISAYRGCRELWHSGNSIGFSTWIARYPERRLTVILLTNRNEVSLRPLVHRVADLWWADRS